MAGLPRIIFPLSIVKIVRNSFFPRSIQGDYKNNEKRLYKMKSKIS